MSKRAYLVTVMVTRRVVVDTPKPIRFFQSIENKPNNPGIFDHTLGNAVIEELPGDSFNVLSEAIEEGRSRFAEDLAENVVAVRLDDEIPYEQGE